MMELLARNMVMMTLRMRRILAGTGWGEWLMNWGSLRHRRRRAEKKGRRQPLNTWATNTTEVRSTEIEKLSM